MKYTCVLLAMCWFRRFAKNAGRNDRENRTWSIIGILRSVASSRSHVDNAYRMWISPGRSEKRKIVNDVRNNVPNDMACKHRENPHARSRTIVQPNPLRFRFQRLTVPSHFFRTFSNPLQKSNGIEMSTVPDGETATMKANPAKKKNSAGKQSISKQ